MKGSFRNSCDVFLGLERRKAKDNQEKCLTVYLVTFIFTHIVLEKTGLPGKVKALANLAGWCYLWNFGVMLIMFNMMGQYSTYFLNFMT